MRQAMTVDAPAMPDVGIITDTTATGAELSRSSPLPNFEATGVYARYESESANRLSSRACDVPPVPIADSSSLR